MHEYDTVLKTLLQDPQNSILERITGAKVAHWLNVELPEVRQTRVDLLAETVDKQLINVELQSGNDSTLPLRMAEYSLRVYRICHQFPKQFALYVGDEEMHMPSELVGPDHICRYTIIDIRTFDEETLLNSPFATDNILAILARHRDRRESIRRILSRIATLKERSARDLALTKLTILGGLRKLGNSIRSEVEKMPILDDIMDHEVIGPAIRQGRNEGRQEEGVSILRKLIHKRFGTLPEWADERLASMPVASLEDLSLRILDVQTLEELFA